MSLAVQQGERHMDDKGDLQIKTANAMQEVYRDIDKRGISVPAVAAYMVALKNQMAGTELDFGGLDRWQIVDLGYKAFKLCATKGLKNPLLIERFFERNRGQFIEALEAGYDINEDAENCDEPSTVPLAFTFEEIPDENGISIATRKAGGNVAVNASYVHLLRTNSARAVLHYFACAYMRSLARDLAGTENDFADITYRGRPDEAKIAKLAYEILRDKIMTDPGVIKEYEDQIVMALEFAQTDNNSPAASPPTAAPAPAPAPG
jgi:hypothetical protein